MRALQRGARIETTLAELQVELLYCFTQAAGCRAQAREYSERNEQYDRQAQYIRKWIERLQQDLVVIEIGRQ